MEKYGCFLIRGSFIRRAGLRCSSYVSDADQRQYFAHQRKRTHAADETLRILIHRPILGELQLVLQHSVVHVGMIVRPKRSLSRRRI